MRLDAFSNQSVAKTMLQSAHAQECPETMCSGRQVLIDNLPYAAMILLGAAIFYVGVAGDFWRWLLSGLYLVYGLAGAVWIMIFVCPYCHFYETRSCPCGYGIIAPKLRARRDGGEFARQFKKHIPAIVPLWFIPPVAGAALLISHFSPVLCGLLIAFVVNSYLILPLVSRRYGCKSCPQKDDCPWMGCGK
jgi:hypothetical protein